MSWREDVSDKEYHLNETAYSFMNHRSNTEMMKQTKAGNNKNKGNKSSSSDVVQGYERRLKTMNAMNQEKWNKQKVK